jgi:hypothetical protein
LITLAPWSAAHVIPHATCAAVPIPWLSSTFTGWIPASQAAPEMSRPLLVSAAAAPSTIVPCPLSSAGGAVAETQL